MSVQSLLREPGYTSGAPLASGSLAGRKALLDLLLKGLPGRDFALQEFPDVLYTFLQPIDTLLVVKRCNLLFHLLQSGISLCLVLPHLFKLRPDLPHLLLYKGHHVLAQPHKCFLLL